MTIYKTRLNLKLPYPVSWVSLTGNILMLVWVLSLHYRIAGTIGGGELVAADPPAHLTSGIMVYEYLHTALGSDPVRFAEGFYVRYPKVAIGHWPPGYYAVQATWYSLFGVSIWSAQALSAATAACLAGLLFRRLGSSGSAFTVALIFLAMPLIQQTAWQVMSDLLTSLFVFFALQAFSDLLHGPKRRLAGIQFLAWSILAILTKGTAWALAPFAVLAPLLAKRVNCYQTAWFWGGCLIMALAGSVFFLIMHSKGMGYPINIGELLRMLISDNLSWLDRLAPLRPMLAIAPTIVLVMALLGFIIALNSRWRLGDESKITTDALVAASWILSQALFFLILPLTEEVRALLPALAPMLLLAARAMSRISVTLNPKLGSFVFILLAGWAIANAGEISMSRVEGYAEAARAIPYPQEGLLILVSSDPAGEGAFIVERLINDPSRAGVVLRAGRMLAESNWSGSYTRLLFDNAAAVREHLKNLAVRYVVIDHSAESTETLRLLADAVEQDPVDFIPVSRISVVDSRGNRHGDVCLYENPAARTQRPKSVQVRLGQERGGKILEYQWP